MKVTPENVLNSFDSFGTKSVSHRSLQTRLRGLGYDKDEIIDVMNAMIKEGTLVTEDYSEVWRPEP